MKDYKIYTMKYLKEKELTENDLYYLFDKYKKEDEGRGYT